MSTDAHDGASPRPSVPRIPPLPEADRDDQARELLAQTGGPAVGATHIFSTLVRHPGLFRKWLPFGGKLLAGKLPARERELLILRTGWNCRSDYEWAQHVRIARAAGVTDGEIDRVRASGDPGDAGWSPSDALLMRAADELHTDACLSDGTWAALAERYDERQMIELPMLVGHYHMVAFALNSLGVQVEDEVAS
jgi:alkylhydroperoxidase family enzyme